MGGFFGGLANALGGAAPEMQAYGHQVREHLERQREKFGDYISQQIAGTNDPQTRAELAGHLTSLYSGKSLAPIMAGVQKTYQNHLKNNDQLVQMIPPPAANPAPQPQGEQSSAGAMAQMLSKPKDTAPAAQPATSPTQGGFTPVPWAGTGDTPTPTTGSPPIPPVQPTGAGAPSSPLPQLAALPVGSAEAPSAASAVQGATGGAGVGAGAEQSRLTNEPLPELYPQGSVQRRVIDLYQKMLTSIGGPSEGLAAQAKSLIDAEGQYQEKTAMERHLMAIGPEKAQKLLALTQQLKGAAPGTPDWLLMNHASAVLGFPQVNMPMTMMNPIHENQLDSRSFVQQYPEISHAMGITADMGPLDVLLDKFTMQPTFVAGRAVPQRFLQTAGGGLAPVNPYNAQVGSTLSGVVAPSQNAQRVVTDAHGNQAFISPSNNAAGGTPTPIPGAMNPAFVPTASGEFRSVSTVDANGNPITKMVPVTTTKSKVSGVGKSSWVPPVSPNGNGGVKPVAAAPSPHGSFAAPGAAPPPKKNAQGVLEFPKSFTPEQQLKGVQQLNQFNQVIDRAENVLAHVPMLENLITAQKIKLNTDPQNGFIMGAINRAVPMTQQEEQLAGDMVSLLEDVNVLRIPLGAAGFRGPEGWAALQSMHGNLTARPGITAKVLQNTLTALRAQQRPLQSRFGAAAGSDSAPSRGVPPEVVSVLSKVGPGVHTLSDGSKWMKGADGSVTPAK